MKKRYKQPKRSASYLRSKWRRRAWARRRKRDLGEFLNGLGIANLSRFILGLGIVIILALSFMAAIFSIGLPNPSDLTVQRATESTKVLDRNGVVLYDIYNERRATLINFDAIPDYVKQATLSAEDKDFYLHSGFDVKGLIRGVVLKPLSGQRAQGGSTITQQYAKNVFLTSSRSVVRKMKEFILAVQLEQLYTKDKILELYLNGISYGGRYYGIEAAAQGYFGKSANELSLAEASTLAAMPQAPSYYSPYGSDYENRLLPRKDWVLKRMFEESYITEKEMEEAQVQELKFLPRKDSFRAPHFVNYVKELLADKYGEKLLEEGGLTITTTLDWKKQEVAENVIAGRIETNRENYNASNAALVSIDPNTGEVLAMVGSADYFDTDIDGYVNVAVRERQPGSAFKPIVYAASFIKGYSPATMLMDVETDFGQGYTPGNYDGEFRGPVLVRSALQESLNVPAVKTLAYVGVNEAISLGHDLGITTLTEPEKYGLSLVLGGAEVKLTELTAAYGVFATGGEKANPIVVLKVEDRKGRVLEENEPDRLHRVMDEEVAYLLNNVLSDDVARVPAFGTGGYLTLSGRPVAAKTGTTQEYRDGWTIGYTPDLVTGVWVGNNDNTPMQNGAGYSVASPIWNSYMRQATASMPVRSFKVPDGIQSVVVDAVSGMLPTDASPGTKTEVFKSGTAPRKTDTIHTKVRVAKVDPTLLAPAHWSEDQVIYKIFSEFHSERPDNRAWENPVLKWAEKNEHNTIPNKYYDGTVQSSGEVSIVAPQNGQKLTTPNFTINATVRNTSLAQEVGFYYDGSLVRKVTSAPWSVEVNNVTLDGRSHLVAARLFRKDGTTIETTISVIAGDGQSDLISMQPITDNVFPLDITARLTDKGKQLNLEKVDVYMDGKVVESFLPNASGYYVTRINDGLTGQHTAFAKIYLKNGTNYNSNTINFETR
ncbi:MAG: PBP1A family penicillin-binding protein [Patescibacteria group bacterium]|nr:PBP1A family penicillin-binding protein [Patescibacteria group bacterium]